MNTLTEKNQNGSLEENEKVPTWDNFKKNQTSRLTNEIKKKMWKERKFIGGLAWKALSSAGSKALSSAVTKPVNNNIKERTRKNRKNRKTRKDRKTRNRKY